MKILLTFIFAFFTISVNAQQHIKPLAIVYDSTVLNGAERINEYLPLLQNNRVGIVANHTSMVGNKHLVDTLLSLGVDISAVFAPEHGFRGNHADGAIIKTYIDSITKIPIVSLYGSSLRPEKKDLSSIDIIIFDIQDVGARFYTYISTMHYMMEACAENNIKMIVFDRPNPNGFYVDGPVLNAAYKSFVGMHQIPIVHGLTVGELALMINGEHWLKNNLHCDLTVIPCENWDHSKLYQLPINPSPNLISMDAIYLYPSLCLFEGTIVSVGRGTLRPFEIIGHPLLKGSSFSFMPKPIKGMSEKPPHNGKLCYGFDLKNYAKKTATPYGELRLNWLIEMYCELYPNQEAGDFFKNSSFDRLAGNSNLRNQIINGTNENTIKKSWQADLKKYKSIRKKYLLYEDFE
ncbi:MAG: DUF1343 domain-containing protein [Bacteroidales bacterium]|jgi:uncharacterized protein YbbC (DUF1343 family)|nr:DUF1343 domain-containing protein [Bacteroidales bacterium]